ncbi:MAG: rod shape-determining protein MreC [Bacteroidota bacterium]
MRNLFRLILNNYFVLLFILLEGVSFLLIFQFNPYQKSLFVNLSRNVNGIIYSQIGDFRQYLYLKDENEQLLNENTDLRNHLSEAREIVYIISPDSLLSDTLAIKMEFQYDFIPADVINNSVNKQYNYLTINRGSRVGVAKDMAVISHGAVVGVVAGVSRNFATVIPLLNRNFRVGSKLERNDYFGILEWEGLDPQYARLKEIPLHVEVHSGDTIVTSGYSAIFPPGYLVGVVESLKVDEGNFYDIKVRLAVDFRKLTHVNVIGNIFREEQQELEKSFGYD